MNKKGLTLTPNEIIELILVIAGMFLLLLLFFKLPASGYDRDSEIAKVITKNIVDEANKLYGSSSTQAKLAIFTAEENGLYLKSSGREICVCADADCGKKLNCENLKFKVQVGSSGTVLGSSENVMTLGLFEEIKLFKGENQINVMGNMAGDFADFLETSVEINGQTKTMKEHILSSIDPYFDIKIDAKTVIERAGDVNKIGSWISSNTNIISESSEISKALEYSNSIFTNSKKILDPKCPSYILKTPYGVVSNLGDYTKFSILEDVERTISQEKQSEWTDWLILNIKYREKEVQISYKRLKVC